MISLFMDYACTAKGSEKKKLDYCEGNTLSFHIVENEKIFLVEL